MSTRSYSRSQLVAAGCILLLAVLFFFSSTLRDAYEDFSFQIDPTPALAVSYGDRHFDAQRPELYNINRAERFYTEAAKLDPTYPRVNHQLARIAFLRGQFHTALFYINKEIDLHGDSMPNSYYVRGLIEGYMGEYASAAKDYEHFLQFDPNNWAGINDYTWVLLKADRNKDAFLASSQGLIKFPANAWLLNSNAIALYEMGEISAAKVQAASALTATKNLTVTDWLHAYPGNDPKIAEDGLASFKNAAIENMHRIMSATSTARYNTPI